MITVDPNKICYVFDVDGTLTEPRMEMDTKLSSEFIAWTANKQCFIATGSDYSKTKEQVPWYVLDCFKYVFCCMGNEVRAQFGTTVHRSSFFLPDTLKSELDSFLENTKFNLKTGNHLEMRTGMANFSIVGRNADFEQRAAYNKWDNLNGERKMMADFINQKYPELEASVGGSISIDIIKKGLDKGQVVHHLKDSGATKIVFVGDRCEEGGNDYGIIRELKKSGLAFEWYNVSGPEDTLKLIRTNKVFDGGK